MNVALSHHVGDATGTCAGRLTGYERMAWCSVVALTEPGSVWT